MTNEGNEEDRIIGEIAGKLIKAAATSFTVDSDTQITAISPPQT